MLLMLLENLLVAVVAGAAGQGGPGVGPADQLVLAEGELVLDAAHGQQPHLARQQVQC